MINGDANKVCLLIYYSQAYYRHAY